MVAQLAPHVRLEVIVLESVSIEHSHWAGHDLPRHAPSQPDRQTLLLTTEDIGAQGWGWPGRCVVSVPLMLDKVARGGDAADILVHVGRLVPVRARRLTPSGVTRCSGAPRWP